MKTKNKSIVFDEEFVERAFDFLNTYYILDIDVNSMFQLSNKEKEVLLKLRNIYSQVKLVKDYKKVKSYIAKNKMLDLANDFMINILPSKSGEILVLDNLIIFDDITTYETGLSYRLSKYDIEIGNISMPDKLHCYDISTIIHEKAHALTFLDLDLASLYENGLELFPMLFEKMMLSDLGDTTATIYNQIIRVNDAKECLFNIDTIKYLEEYSEDKVIGKLMYDYFYIKSYDYLLSDLYSSILARYYSLDKETMIKRLNALFTEKITIKAFLDSYNISLLNKDLIPIIKEETSKCKRIMIMP